MRVLLVEDDSATAKSIEMMLRSEGYVCDSTDLGEDGLEIGKLYDYDIIVLDLMLPDIDGYEVLRRLRAAQIRTPILILSGLSELDAKIKGLGFGADDYLTKPFSIHELLARVKAIFRRAEVFDKGRKEDPTRLSAGDMVIDVEKRGVTVAGRPVDLTAKEFDLLLQFAEHPGRVYSRQQLLDLVWGYRHMGYEHTVNSHINRLRGKIEKNPAEPEYVLTVWGVGYKFNDRLVG